MDDDHKRVVEALNEFYAHFRASRDVSLLDDAEAFLKSATDALNAGDAEQAGRLGRAALVFAIIAADACVTDSLEIAHHWAGASQTDVPSDLLLGPFTFDSWKHLMAKIKSDRMSFLDKIHFGFGAIFHDLPCDPGTIEAIESARRLRNRLVHLTSLRDRPDHELLFSPAAVVEQARKAVDAVDSLVQEIDEFFDRWRLQRAKFMDEAGD